MAYERHFTPTLITMRRDKSKKRNTVKISKEEGLKDKNPRRETFKPRGNGRQSKLDLRKTGTKKKKIDKQRNELKRKLKQRIRGRRWNRNLF